MFDCNIEQHWYQWKGKLMNKMIKISAVAAALLALTACNQEQQKSPVEAPVAAQLVLENDDQKAAYAIGVSMAEYLDQSVKKQEEVGVAIDRTIIAQGVADYLAGKSQLDPEQVKATLDTFSQKLTALFEAKAKEASAKVEAEGKAYLADNAKKEGVVTTESGLQYEVLTAGEGESPLATDKVTVHYKGMLIDGTPFDSSYDRGEPSTFPLNGVIPGWTEGVQLMKPGAKFKFTIPSTLAYGERDTPTIPANSTLVFEVELISVNKAQAVKS